MTLLSLSQLSHESRRIDGGQLTIAVPPHSAWTGDVETIIGHWADVTYTYRFGPPAHDLVTVELRADGEVLGSGRRYPLGRARAA